MFRFSRNTLILVGFGLLIALFLFIGGLSVYEVSSLFEVNDYVEHQHAVINRLALVRELIQRVENNKRGYVITGDSNFLQAYETGKQQLAQTVADLHILSAGEPSLNNQVVQLHNMLDKRLLLIEQVIDTRRTQGIGPATALIEAGQGEQLTNDLLHLISVADNQADEKLAQRLEAISYKTQVGNIATFSSVILGVGLLAGTLYWLFQEVRHRNRLTATLHQQTVELQERNADLDAFAHTVAHDLKNPLSVINGLAQSLNDKNQPPLTSEELDQYLQAIMLSAQKANDIIEELLLLASVRISDITLKPLDMGHIVAQAQSHLSEMIEMYHGKIIVPPASNWPPVMGHAGWVEQVWVNYMSNGLKYGGTPPCLELGTTPLPDGRVKFWVHDNGPGVNPELQDKLFVPFSRLDPARAAGHGLGLANVRNMVEKMGGHVMIESDTEPGCGATFSFTLPGMPASKRDGTTFRD